MPPSVVMAGAEGAGREATPRQPDAIINPTLGSHEFEHLFAWHVAQRVVSQAIRAVAERDHALLAVTVAAMPAALTYARRTWHRVIDLPLEQTPGGLLGWNEVAAGLRPWVDHGPAHTLAYDN